VDAALVLDEVNFPPRSTTAVIDIFVIDDFIAEPSEDFFIELLPASGVELGIKRARITIIDNDGEIASLQV